MNGFIDQYIQAKTNSWHPSTLRSEALRLRAMQAVLDGDAQRLWDWLTLSGYAPYARVTYWVRATQYWNWLIENGLVTPGGPNPYAKWRSENAQCFRNCYERQVPSISFDGARDRICGIGNPAIRQKALELLCSGLRWTESFTLKNGRVTGKGGKRRKVFACAAFPAEEGRADTAGAATGQVAYRTFVKELGKVGLKPHDLRKIYAAELVRRGANVFQLQKALGWGNLNTAQSYIEADDKGIEELVK